MFWVNVHNRNKKKPTPCRIGSALGFGLGRRVLLAQRVRAIFFYPFIAIGYYLAKILAS